MFKKCSKCSCVGFTTIQGVVYDLYICNKEHIMIAFSGQDHFMSSATLKSIRRIAAIKPDNWLDAAFIEGYKLFCNSPPEQIHL